MSKEQEIGNLFKESLQGYKAEPPAELWDSIAQDKTLLKFNRRKSLLRAGKIAAFPLAGLIAVIIISTVFFPKSQKDDSRTATTETAVVTTTTASATPSSPIPSAPITNSGNNVANLPAPRQNSNINAIQPAEEKDVVITTQAAAVAETPASESEPTDNPATNARNDNPEKKAAPRREEATPAANIPATQPKSGQPGLLLWSHDTTVCRNSELTLYVKNAMDVQWNLGYQGESVTLFPEEPLVVAATITTYDKTDTTVYIHIGVVDCGLWIPTAFTPNGDGLNDEFLVRAPADINRYECTIYDRTRGLLFRSQNILQGWDGTFNGKPLPFGSYFYIITYYDALGVKHVEKGQVTLIR